MKKLSQRINQISSGKVALLVTVIYILFMIIVLPMQSEKSKIALKNNPSPDMSFVYSSQDLYKMAESYGVKGRKFYVKARYTFDIVWPLVYGLFLTITIAFILKNTINVERYMYLNLLPIGGVILDFLENISTSIVMVQYPLKMDFITTIAPIFTLSKWIVLSISFSFLIIGCVYLISIKIKNNFKTD